MNIDISNRTNKFIRYFAESKNIDSKLAFQKYNIGIACNNKILKKTYGQVMVSTLINLVSRFVTDMNVYMKKHTKNKIWMPFGHEELLSTSLIKMAREVNSNIKLNNHVENDIVISIGETELQSEHKISINSDGWLSIFSLNDKNVNFISENENAIGALTSACFGASELFRRLLELLSVNDRRIILKETDFVFSNLTYSFNERDPRNPILPERISLGDLTIIGAGAVGNSLLYSLNIMPQIHATIDLIDYQNYDTSNMNRCLMVSKKHINLPKVAAIDMVVNNRININQYNMNYEEYRTKKKNVEISISTVDDINPRVLIQLDLPKLLFHGATGQNVMTISRHNFLNGACLGCIFYYSDSMYVRLARDLGISVLDAEHFLDNEIKIDEQLIKTKLTNTIVDKDILYKYLGKTFDELYIKEICGNLVQQTPETQVSGTVSFVSALPGILISGELIKSKLSNLEEYSLDNYFRLSLFNPPSAWLIQRKKDERCICNCTGSIYREIYQKKWC